MSNLILAAENLADHFTHFYLFFMPDFARDAYRGRPWFDAAAARFKATAAPGSVMQSGLWHYTRHPNYFGDACAWWGIWLVAATAWPAISAIVSPIFLTWTLTRWSGAPMLETGLRKSRPGYEDYIRRTSSFFPCPPKDS